MLSCVFTIRLHRVLLLFIFFFFNDTATTEIYTLSLHDALPIYRFLPDKAIDLIDEAAAKIKIEIDSKPEVMDKLERRMIQLKIEREAMKKEKDEASQKRLQLIEEELGSLEREYADLEEVWKRQKASAQRSEHIRKEIAQTRSQDSVLAAVVNAIRLVRSGLSVPNRPTGSFLFLGPTGVGKTELCKALAGFLFDSEDHLVRIDMSEFMEKHSVARLIGAPPGYVGYEEGGYLTEAVRRKPYSVLLLDEVEKAHPDVFNVLLQVLDDGRLTDGQGRTVDFKNTVIVMTSNIGSLLIQAMVGEDYDDVKDAVWGELKNHFRPEFLNRIDETVVFHALDAKNIESIARIQLKLLERRLEKMDLALQVSDQALAELAKVGFDPVFGARPLKRAIH